MNPPSPIKKVLNSLITIQGKAKTEEVGTDPMESMFLQGYVEGLRYASEIITRELLE